MKTSEEPLELAICMGSSCFSRGNNRTIEVIKSYIERHGLQDKIALKGHLCEGLCEDGPNITLGAEMCHCVDSAKITALLREYFKRTE
jgi:NADH:ubiquinone oxidoreductase subunit E